MTEKIEPKTAALLGVNNPCDEEPSVEAGRDAVRSGSGSFSIDVGEDHEAMSQAAAAFIVEEIELTPDALVCVSTGASPTRIYELLVARGQRDPRLLEHVRWLQLDEWLGIPAGSRFSCGAYLRHHLVGPLHVDPTRFAGWNTDMRHAAAECHRMADWIVAQGPIDLAILGMGVNGHLGFNEPAGELKPDPHVTKLAETSRNHAMLKGFNEKVSHGVTLGMANLLQARKIVLIASGVQKKKQVATLLAGRISTQFPASCLWMHPAVTLFCDRTALGESKPEMLP